MDTSKCFGFTLHNFSNREFNQWKAEKKFNESEHNKTIIGLIPTSTLPVNINGYKNTLVLTKLTSEILPMADLAKSAENNLHDIPMSEDYILFSENSTSSITEEMEASRKTLSDKFLLNNVANRIGVYSNTSTDDDTVLKSKPGLIKPLYVHKYEYVIINYETIINIFENHPELLDKTYLDSINDDLVTPQLPFINTVAKSLKTHITVEHNFKDIFEILSNDVDLIPYYENTDLQTRMTEAFDAIKFLALWANKLDPIIFLQNTLTTQPDFTINTHFKNSLFTFLQQNSNTEIINIDPQQTNNVTNVDNIYYRRVHSLSYTNDVNRIQHPGILSPVFNKVNEYNEPTISSQSNEVYPHTMHIWPDTLHTVNYLINDISRYSNYGYLFQLMDYQTDVLMPCDKLNLERPLFQLLTTCQLFKTDDKDLIAKNDTEWQFRMTFRIYIDRNTFYKWINTSMTTDGIMLIKDTSFFNSICNKQRQQIGNIHFDMSKTNIQSQDVEEEELMKKTEDELKNRVIVYQRTPQNCYHPSWQLNNNDIETMFNNLPMIKNGKETGKVTTFTYQKRNVIWMMNVEKRVDNHQHVLECPTLGLYLHNPLNNPYGKPIANTSSTVDKLYIGGKSYYMNHGIQRIIYPAKDGQPRLAMDMHCIRSGDNNVNMKLELTGGIIADDVGLGKTLSTIYHMANQLEKDKSRQSLPYEEGGWQLNNLVIVPSRLLKQWALEVEKFFGKKYFKVITLGTINDVYKMYKSTGMLKPKTQRNKKTDTPSTTTKNATPASTKNKTIEKYDIYIVSANLLTNDKYWQDIIIDNTPTKTSTNNTTSTIEVEDYDIEKCFDIFRIKWNRIIIDEIHECVQSLCVDGIDKCGPTGSNIKLACHTIFNLQSNYRWGLSATPFEHKELNLAGYLGYLSKLLKNNLCDTSVVKKLYFETFNGGTPKKQRDIANIFNSKMPIYSSLNAITKYLDSTCVDNLQKMCLSKTSKKSVSSELDIPIFTEDVIPITLGPIERNIYNNAKTDNSRSRDRLQRLFQLCTNICISTQDMDSLEIDLSNNMMSLTELNDAMISMFSKKLNKVTKKLSEMKTTLENYDICINNINILHKKFNEMDKYGKLPYINYTDKKEIERYMHDCYRANKMIEENGLNSNQVNQSFGINHAKYYLCTYVLRSAILKYFIDFTDTSDSSIDIIKTFIDSITTEEKLPANIITSWSDGRITYLIRQILKWHHDNATANRKRREESIVRQELEKTRLTNQIKLFENTDFLKEKTDEPCPICWVEYEDDDNVVITDCRHILCGECFEAIASNNTIISCPECRSEVIVNKVKVTTIKEIKGIKQDEPNIQENNEEIEENKWMSECINKYGTKMANLVKFLRNMIKNNDADGNKQRAIIFSQYDNMLKLIGKTLDEYNIPNIFPKGNVRSLTNAIDKFKTDDKYRVIMLSSERSNSGSNLTEANHVIIVDVLNMDADRTKEVESQIIGRAVRLGQKRPVKVVRLVTQDTVESQFFDANRYDISTIQ